MHRRISHFGLSGVLLVLALCVALIPASLAAATTPTLRIGSASGRQGHPIQILVSLQGGPSVSGASFAVSYDPTAIVPLKAEASGKAAVSLFTVVTNFDTDGLIRVALAGPSPLPPDGGVLFTLTFDVVDGAPEGSYPLFLLNSTIVSATGSAVRATAEHGVVLIQSTRGDVNKDGLITQADADLALAFATEQTALTAKELAAADMNGDGAVTVADVVLIFKMATPVAPTLPDLEMPAGQMPDVPPTKMEWAPTGSGQGVVTQVYGDLAYVSGLNGTALEGSTLTSSSGAELQVIKHLDTVLVTRSLSGAVAQRADVRVLEVGANGTIGHARRKVFATKVAEGPKVDGRLDDPAWLRAQPVTGFVQRDPDYWMPATEKTSARVVFDERAIYFAFECFTSEGYRLVANNMRRDAEIWGDDNIQILLDTYNDRQTGYFFFVNPLGAQRDMTLSNEGRSYNDDWDCNWTCRTQRYEDRWTVEVRIPFDQLRYKPSEDMAWGINFARNISSRNEETQFVVGRRGSSSRARYWTSDIGELRGLGSVSSRRPIQIKPYVLPGTSRNFEAASPAEEGVFESGVDLRYGVTSNLTFDFSYNTDFAQVEGDQEQVNLTQFRLFFPEKREFFLEGNTIFNFGEQAERTGGGSRPPTLLFYSRRIGLDDGVKVPIIFGSKLAGRQGRTSIGALNVLTDNEVFIDDEDGDTTSVRRANYSVIRLKQDVLKSSNVGLMLVNKNTTDPVTGDRLYNRAGGVDFSYSPTPALNVSGFVARTWDTLLGDTTGVQRTGDAVFGFANYQAGLFSSRVRYLEVTEGFEPGVGFVNRRGDLEGFRRYDGRVRLRPRPGVLNIRYISIGPQIQVWTDRNNNVQFWRGSFNMWTQFNTADWWRMELERTHDVVTESFEPSDRRPEVVIPPGKYDFTTFTIGPSMSRSRKLRPRFFLEAGEYYTGRRYRLNVDTAWRPSGRFSIETEVDANWLRLPEGNLNIQTVSSRIIYSLTTDFFVKVFAQLNNEKELVSSNFLLNYRYKPGSDLFLVYDSSFGTTGGFTRRNRSVLLKMSYQLSL